MKRIILTAVLVIAGVHRVDAGYIFGSTNDHTPNFLIVTTSTGSVTLGTDTNEINPSTNNQGWWSVADINFNDNDNFIAADPFTQPQDLINDFFTFDITSLAGQTVTGITLNIQNPGFNTEAALYSVFDVSTDALTLNAKANNPNTAIYNDLGSGTLYGSQLIPLVNDPEYFIALNATAISDLQAAIDTGSTFFSTGGTIYPSVDAPEPGSVALFALGLVSIIGRVGWLRKSTRHFPNRLERSGRGNPHP